MWHLHLNSLSRWDSIRWDVLTVNWYLFRTLSHVWCWGSMSSLRHVHCASAPALRPLSQIYTAFHSLWANHIQAPEETTTQFDQNWRRERIGSHALLGDYDVTEKLFPFDLSMLQIDSSVVLNLQWRIQDFPEEGCQTQRGTPEYCMKINTFRPRGGHPSHPPLDPPLPSEKTSNRAK